MTTKLNNDLRDLSATELDLIAGGARSIDGCIPRPGPKGPKLPFPFPPTTGPTMPFDNDTMPIRF
jgi:hypothetical protein